ncbi:hypothetical protein GOODEAATRI_009445 [Goodea atripinnis]|uniref:Uncharacterized protein n=1 Tax=Goodea atripinnis TaxID=208336 RepID=A0ABV0NK94_9TELE
MKIWMTLTENGPLLGLSTGKGSKHMSKTTKRWLTRHQTNGRSSTQPSQSTDPDPIENLRSKQNSRKHNRGPRSLDKSRVTAQRGIIKDPLSVCSNFWKVVGEDCHIAFKLSFSVQDYAIAIKCISMLFTCTNSTKKILIMNVLHVNAPKQSVRKKHNKTFSFVMFAV